MTGTYETIDGRPALRFERRIAHPVERVWHAVTDPSELAHWFPAAVAGDLRPGGAVTFGFPGEDAPSTAGEVLSFDPPRSFVFTWEGEELRFELEPLDGGAGCLLRFAHLLEGPGVAARTAAGWDVCLELLGRLLDGEPAGPPPAEPTGEWQEHYEAYLRAGVPSGAPVPDGG